MRIILILSFMISVGFAAPVYAASASKSVTQKKSLNQKKKRTVKKKVAKKKSNKKKTKVTKNKKTKKMSEADRKVLAWKQVQQARKIAAERKAKEEAAKNVKPLQAQDRVQPQPVVEVTGMKDDYIQVSDAQAIVVERDLSFASETPASNDIHIEDLNVDDFDFSDDDAF